MPYFERKAWEQNVGGPGDESPIDVARDVNMADLAQSVLSAETGPQHGLDGPFRCRKPVRPGERGVIVLSVTADDNGGPLTLDLSSGDLRGRDGQVIAGNLVQIEPQHLTIPPGNSASFDVRVFVPLEATLGLYSGRVSGDGPEQISFIVEFEVDTPAGR